MLQQISRNVMHLGRRIRREVRMLRRPRHPFDRTLGIETSRAVPFWKRRSGDHFLDGESVGYAGAQPSVIRHALELIGDLEDATFIDIGCGKGRPLAVATEFPFKRIVGLEMVKALCKSARRNSEAIRRVAPERTPIEIIEGDATRLTPSIYGRNIVLFLYNSFGRNVFTSMLESVLDDMAHHPGMKVVLIYDNPVQADLLDGSPHFERVFADMCEIAEGDMPGSVFGNRYEPLVIYQNHAAPMLTRRPGANRAVVITIEKYMSTIL